MFWLQTLWPVSNQNKKVAYHTLHYFGDAFSTIYTEVPQELEIFHANFLQSGETSFAVTANEGALIALSVNDELIGVEEGTGEAVVIQIPPQSNPDQVLVTVTKQNYYRYESIVPVVSFTGLNELTRGNDISIYPNPSSGLFSLKCKIIEEYIDIKILNALSKVVQNITKKTHKEDDILINLNDQPPGLYYVVLESASEKTIHKIVIQ